MLWDIDHTLIETRGVGRQLYRQAFEAVTGRTMQHQVDPTGRTELAIFDETLQRHGVTPSDDLRRAYTSELARQYQQHEELVRQRGRRLPGAAEALAALAPVPGIVQTVLTGNLRDVAATKLRVFDLTAHLDLEVGAYGEDDDQRPKLVTTAQVRAGSKYGMTFDRGSTVVVGDTTHDVAAARQGQAAILAVASGRDSADELRRAGAKVVLPDLTGTGQLVEAVLGAAATSAEA